MWSILVCLVKIHSHIHTSQLDILQILFLDWLQLTFPHKVKILHLLPPQRSSLFGRSLILVEHLTICLEFVVTGGLLVDDLFGYTSDSCQSTDGTSVKALTWKRNFALHLELEKEDPQLSQYPDDFVRLPELR